MPFLEDLASIVACAACGARHHAECHRENRRCATCGDSRVLVPQSQPPVVSAPVTKESTSVYRLLGYGCVAVVSALGIAIVAAVIAEQLLR